MRTRRLQVDALPAPGARLALPLAASHHLLVVCRHPRGAPLVLFDGAGNEVDAVLVDGRELAEVEGRSLPRGCAQPTPLHLVLGVPKGSALDQALRMAVEIGVTHVHPVLAERSVPRGERVERWERIVVAAAQQCGRADLPVVLPVTRLLDVELPAGIDRRVGVPGADPAPAATGPAAFAVGPEGGFSPREVDALLASGWTAVGLGPHVLRVDTAVAVGLALTASAGRSAGGARELGPEGA